MRQYLVIIFLTFYFSNSYCQKNNPVLINFLSAGELTEVGISFFEYEKGKKYTPIIIGGIFEIPLYKTKNFFNVTLSIYPNFVVVFHSKETTYEFGINVRANFNFAVSKLDVLRAIIGSGPQYFDCHCCRQAYGFLFSDYLMIGYRRYFILNNRYCNFDFEFGYRHISNASIYEPNDGINNLIIGIGFNVVLNTKGMRLKL